MANRLTFHVKKGDTVKVVSGNHKWDKENPLLGIGKVLQVLPKKQQVIVEGVRMITKHVRKSQDHPQGARLEREGPIHISNVKLVEKAEAKKPAKKK